MAKIPSVRFLPGQRVFSFLEASPVYPMHVSGGNGRQYRAHFRRDFPTGQAFPNLWPHRIRMGATTLINWPKDLLEEWNDVLSEPGVVSDDGQAITYVAKKETLFETAQCTITMLHGSLDTDQQWTWLYEDDTVAGFLFIQTNFYMLDDESDIWEVSGPLPPAGFVFTAVGAFSSVQYAGDSPTIEMFAAEWADLPPDEQNP